MEENAREQQPRSQMRRIVLFDGICVLCNHSVNFLLSIDHEGRLKYATLQGHFAKMVLSEAQIKDLKTIVYIRGDEILTQSTAILSILRDLGGIWKFISFLKIVPRPLRDFIYVWISNNRYKIFGKRKTCRLPTADEREKFID